VVSGERVKERQEWLASLRVACVSGQEKNSRHRRAHSLGQCCILPRVPCVDYRHHLRAVVAASAAPYGYTLTLWTAGAVTTHAQGLPSALDALLLLAGAVTGFAAVAAFAYGGITGAFAPGTRGEIRVWGGLHLPSVGSSILLVWVVTQVAHGHPAWLLVGFTATSTYLLVIGLQFWLATHRGHVPEPQDSDDPPG
jgi:hypothetical protein